MGYEVSTPVFEGPLDLLLHLILREQVDLYQVSIREIVDGYLRELARMHERADRLDLEVATEFLLIAATLVELKARRLLPGRDDVGVDDELALWESRDLLLARLVEAKTFKDAAAALAALADRAARSRPRTAGPEEHFVALTPDPLAGVTPAQLRAAFVRACTPRPKPTVSLDHVAPIRVSVTDAVEELLRTLPRQGITTFRSLTAGLGHRLAIVVRFLGLLELCKQGLVELDQDLGDGGLLGDLVVLWVGPSERLPVGVLAGIDAYDG